MNLQSQLWQLAATMELYGITEAVVKKTGEQKYEIALRFPPQGEFVEIKFTVVDDGVDLEHG